MAEIFIPTLHTFAMGNPFTGSCGNLRFLIAPNVVMATPKEVAMEESTLTVKYWYGKLCMEKSAIEEERTFPMSEAGRADLKQWLESLG